MSGLPIRPFTNPRTRSWVEEFSSHASMGRLMAALAGSSADEALAAAEIVAAMRGHASPDLPASAWRLLSEGNRAGLHSGKNAAGLARQFARRAGPAGLAGRLGRRRRSSAGTGLTPGDVVRLDTGDRPAFGRMFDGGQLAVYREVAGSAAPIGSRDYLFTVPMQWAAVSGGFAAVARDPFGEGESSEGPPRFLQDPSFAKETEGFWLIGGGVPRRSRAAQVAFLERDLPWSAGEVIERIREGDGDSAAVRLRWPVFVNADGGGVALPWDKWPAEWLGRRPGTVVEIPLGDGRFVHGRTLDGGWVAFYRRIAGRAGEWEAGSRDFAFTVAVEPLLGEVVGEDPFGPGESPAPPPEWRQDGSGFFYTTDGADERLAAASQCVGLERHGVAWTVEQVAERFVKGFRSPFWRLRAPVLYGSDGRRERRFWPALGEVPLLRHDLDFLRSAGRREAAAGQAERLLEAAWLKNPSGPWLADHLREFAEVTFSSPAAAQALEEAVAFPGVGAESHFRCAIDWFGAGRYSRCLEQVARAVQMDRHLEFEGRLLKANAYLEWGDLAAAGVELRRKTASGQEGSVAWLSQSASRDALKCLRAKLCFVHGNHGPAYRLYRQVCPDPAACDSPAAREALLMQAVLARTAGRWDEAEELLRACLNIWEAIGPDRQPAGLHEESPGLARTLIEFGALLTAKSRLDEAADLLREAGRLLEPRAGDSHPLVALAQFHLGRVSMQREDEPEARRHLCAALQIQWTALLPSHPDLVRTEELLRVLGYLPNFV